jgi:hypothetical protein
MTIAEYRLRMDVAVLKHIDDLNLLAHQALFNRIAQSTDSKGKYVAKTVKDIFDADKAASAVSAAQKKTQYKELLKIAQRVKEYHAQKGVEADGQ